MIADQLRYFLVAAKHEHLGRAAEELGMSQPALSRSILRLEEDLGVPLFDRAGRGVRLNPSGRILLRRVERAFAELEDAQRELTERAATKIQTVSIGFLATLGVHFVPNLIRTFCERDPNVTFQLLQGPHPQLREQLLGGTIDLCISSPRFADSNIEWRPLYDEELRVLVPADHRLAGRGEIDLSELADEPWVAMKEGYGLRQALEDLCKQVGFKPILTFQGEEVATLRGLVGAGLGVTIAPKSTGGIEGLCVSLKIKNPNAFRTIGISWRRGRYMPEKATAFRNFVVTTCANQRTPMGSDKRETTASGDE